ncbi:hypothetical protein E2C01_030422 [Portunus trituberculatus]|uniref:Uncharacterized protein n=1 Tax=Portunus trituberculatus TaxID=210409 RepID=A0A5B7EQE1_PORTR|nr:hypothetical protein [Portunus trituberculatus]
MEYVEGVRGREESRSGEGDREQTRRPVRGDSDAHKIVISARPLAGQAAGTGLYRNTLGYSVEHAQDEAERLRGAAEPRSCSVRSPAFFRQLVPREVDVLIGRVCHDITEIDLSVSGRGGGLWEEHPLLPAEE